MAIRLAHNCINCDHLMQGDICSVHKVMVNDHYTCDSFEMKSTLVDDINCVTCVRYEESDCANPEKAAPGMLCAAWAPQRANA